MSFTEGLYKDDTERAITIRKVYNKMAQATNKQETKQEDRNWTKYEVKGIASFPSLTQPKGWNEAVKKFDVNGNDPRYGLTVLLTKEQAKVITDLCETKIKAAIDDGLIEEVEAVDKSGKMFVLAGAKVNANLVKGYEPIRLPIKPIDRTKENSDLIPEEYVAQVEFKASKKATELRKAPRVDAVVTKADLLEHVPEERYAQYDDDEKFFAIISDTNKELVGGDNVKVKFYEPRFYPTQNGGFTFSGTLASVARFDGGTPFTSTKVDDWAGESLEF